MARDDGTACFTPLLLLPRKSGCLLDSSRARSCATSAPSAPAPATILAMSTSASPDLDLEGWEEWDGKSSFFHHCIAGSMAGVSEHVLMFPFDTYKVRALGRWRERSGT